MVRPMKFRMVVGTWERHEVEVVYTRALRLFSIVIDGRTVFRHCRLLPWAARLGVEIKTPGREAHTLVVEPPDGRARTSVDARGYLVWLDGEQVVRVSAD